MELLTDEQVGNGNEGSDALGWRELLESAADEIDRLRIIVEAKDNNRTAADSRG